MAEKLTVCLNPSLPRYQIDELTFFDMFNEVTKVINIVITSREKRVKAIVEVSNQNDVDLVIEKLHNHKFEAGILKVLSYERLKTEFTPNIAKRIHTVENGCKNMYKNFQANNCVMTFDRKIQNLAKDVSGIKISKHNSKGLDVSNKEHERQQKYSNEQGQAILNINAQTDQNLKKYVNKLDNF